MAPICPRCGFALAAAAPLTTGHAQRLDCPGCGEDLQLAQGVDGHWSVLLLSAVPELAVVLPEPGDELKERSGAEDVVAAPSGSGEGEPRERRETVPEGSADRALAASPTGLLAAAPSRPARREEERATVLDAPSVRLQPRLADSSARRPALDTRRELPSVAAPVVDTEVGPAPPSHARQGVPWAMIAVVAALLGTLVATGAWLALRMEARVGPAPDDPLLAGGAGPAPADRRAADPPRPADDPPAAPAAALAAPAVPQPAPRLMAATDHAPAAAVFPAAPGQPQPDAAAAPPPPERADPPDAVVVPAVVVPETAAQGARGDVWEVFGTAADASAPWLALRATPAPRAALLAELPDGTPVRVTKTQGRWRRVEVIDGASAGRVGWVHADWLRQRDAGARP